MNTKLTLTVLMLLFALALSGCVGYASYGYSDYPYYYDYGYYPYGYLSFHHDFDGFHHFRHGGHFGGHLGGHEGRGRS
jgi:hypothetical protein